MNGKPKPIRLWFSCSKFTGKVIVNEHEVILSGMNIIKKFFGQNLGNLVAWCRNNEWTPIKIIRLPDTIPVQGERLCK